MSANDTNEKIIHKELSYKLVGLFFEVHNALGRFCKEKQYGDALEELLRKQGVQYKREKEIPVLGIPNKFTNKADFVINEEILLELKAKPIITKENYYQTNRYLNASGYKLGMIVNFRNKYLKPIRVIRANS